MSPERTIFKEIEEHTAAFRKVEKEFLEKGKVLAQTCVDEFFKEHPEVENLFFDCDQDGTRFFFVRVGINCEELSPWEMKADSQLRKCLEIMESRLSGLAGAPWEVFELHIHNTIKIKNPYYKEPTEE